MERIRRGFVAIAAGVCMMLGAAAAKTLVPGGQSIGVALKTGGAVIAGTSDIGSRPSPARKSGLKNGDVIMSVNGEPVAGAADVTRLLQTGNNSIGYIRDGAQRTALLEPINDKGELRIGAWVRDSAAGVGTLTYYDPQTGVFGALGHPVTDADAGIVLPVADGSIYENSIIGVEKGKNGSPGEILGQFYGKEEVGEIRLNDGCGIFGVSDGVEGSMYPEGIEIAGRQEVHPGKAEILATVDDEGMRSFDCEIIRIEDYAPDTNRSFAIRVTDEELIGITGGIVQGMSGSPIIQDGKIAGAVTHVLVDDPTRGYGIFIENMLEAA